MTFEIAASTTAMTPLPQQFVEMLDRMPGYEDVARALVSTPSPVTVRLNPYKPLGYILPEADRVPWEPSGYYLEKRPQFTFMPELYDGRFYVQDASSMIIGEAVRRVAASLPHPALCLDACAAPGGKSLSILSSLPEDSFLLANEYDRSRVSGLIDNLQRWGTNNYAVSSVDGRRLADIGPLFNIALADVPCSGEGMMRKNETAVTQWSERLVGECADLQRQIVESVWQTLLPGGWLIYSTCTFNTAENESNAAWIRDTLGAEPVDLGLTEYAGVSSGVDTDIPCVRMLPGRVRGEGQFLAVFRKPETMDVSAKKQSAKLKKAVIPYRLDGDFVGIESSKGELYAVRAEFAPTVAQLTSRTNVIAPGIHAASPKGRDFVPAQALATALAADNGMFPEAEVDYMTAMSYLRGEALRLPSDVPRGFVVITCGGCRLGFVKNIGSRANNLLPDGLRIRSPHIPDERPTLL